MRVTSNGNPIDLVGTEVKVGDFAKEFVLSKNDFSPAKLSDYGNKTKVLSIVPSLDTGICDAQTRKFNADLDDRDDLVVITISMDLPTAQGRWCGNAGLENAITLSAHKDEVFAKDYGVLIEDIRLLARAVFILDENNKIIYVQYVPEVGSHPNYEEVLEFLKE